MNLTGAQMPTPHRLLLIAVCLFTSTVVAAGNESRWIFPGQNLPADIPYLPMKASADGAADVLVNQRDWFLLKPSRLLSATVNGPSLNDTNAQVYFRLVSGMIL